MKKSIYVFLVLLINIGFSAQISWYNNFDQACLKAQKEKKNIFLYFTGSDYCPWCQKFSKEILENPDFVEMTSSSFIFVYLDYPAHKTLPPQQVKQNKILKDKYRIQGFPTAVLLDKQQGIITKMGYLPMGGKRYAQKINQAAEECNHLNAKNFNSVNSIDLKRIYQKAKTMGCKRLINKVMEAGLKKEDNLFFYLEKYCDLIESDKLEEAQSIKQHIIQQDSNNLKRSFLRMAIIDFETLSKNKNGEDPKKIIEPLLDYITNFGKTDTTNLWRLEMIISNFLSSKGFLKESLYHARASYKAAPVIVKKDLAQTILYLKKRIQEEKTIAE